MPHSRVQAPGAARPGLTLWLGIALACLIADSWLAFSQGQRGLLLHFCVVFPASYFVCICVHDAVHGVLHRLPGVSAVAGFALSLVVGLPFPLLRSAHLKHHQTVGKHDDPEAIIYRSSLLLLLLRLPVVPLFYLRSLRDLSWGERAATFAHLALVLAACWVGGADFMVGWGMPTVFAIIWFGFTTVYVPHSRHASHLMHYLRAHSGWHDDHHRDPHYPFPQYVELRAWHLAQRPGAPADDASTISLLASRIW